MAQAPHHVYFVHGIGRHSRDWIDDKEASGEGRSLREEIANAWKPYAQNGRFGAFADELDLVSLSYDHVFEALYAQWETEVATLKTHLAAFPGAAAELDPLVRIAEAPASGTADAEFFYTHVLDLLWYWGNSLVQGKIVAEVAEQLLTEISKHYGKPGHSFSIVGHSMGTSVVHKVLQALWTQPEYDGRLEAGRSLSAVLKLRLLMQVSNTSFVLSADAAGHYRTLVKPSSIANRGVCATMANVSNEFDLISETIPFDPPRDEWLDAHSQIDDCYLNIRTRRLTAPNVHAITHYFQNPLVHQPFFERVLQRRIPVALKRRALDDFQAASPAGRFKLLKQQLDGLASRDTSSRPRYVTAAREFVDLVRSFDGSVA